MSTHHTFHISRMSNEQNDWQRGLDFYKDEIKIHAHRLADVSGMYAPKDEVKPQVEHFQNQFIVQRVLSQRYNALEQKINDLRHEHNRFLAKYI